MGLTALSASLRIYDPTVGEQKKKACAPQGKQRGAVVEKDMKRAVSIETDRVLH